jgi:phosphoribosylglycinamide formyltransferase-1
MIKKKKRIAVFASGAGSNAAALIEFFKQEEAAEVCLVVSNRADAGVHGVADAVGIESVILTKQDLLDEEMVLGLLQGYAIDVVVLAGWLLLMPSYLVRMFEGRMVNIHPALLPKHGGKGMWGKHVHEAVKAAGETKSGITIHLVNERYDEGAVLAQYEIAIAPTDDVEEIERKVRALELRHLPSEVKKLCDSL